MLAKRKTYQTVMVTMAVCVVLEVILQFVSYVTPWMVFRAHVDSSACTVALSVWFLTVTTQTQVQDAVVAVSVRQSSLEIHQVNNALTSLIKAAYIISIASLFVSCVLLFVLAMRVVNPANTIPRGVPLLCSLLSLGMGFSLAIGAIVTNREHYGTLATGGYTIWFQVLIPVFLLGMEWYESKKRVDEYAIVGQREKLLQV